MNPTLAYFYGGSPLWVWLSGLGISLTFLALFVIILYDRFGPRPLKRVQVLDTHIELWERERKMPGGADAIVVPVAPDLKMSTGIAKWVRDATANTVQYEALKVAPLQPGEVFVGSGGKFRFGTSALAVVMDDQKRTSPEWIREGVATALRKLREHDAHTVLIPDMTEDLLQQPKTITDEQRLATCRPVARAVVDGILESDTDYDTIKIWIWKGNRAVWEEELARLAEDIRTGQARPVPA
jgi:O-acetyl-ADP-ribose deacetylase (regulator of RNase III)